MNATVKGHIPKGSVRAGVSVMDGGTAEGGTSGPISAKYTTLAEISSDMSNLRAGKYDFIQLYKLEYTSGDNTYRYSSVLQRHYFQHGESVMPYYSALGSVYADYIIPLFGYIDLGVQCTKLTHSDGTYTAELTRELPSGAGIYSRIAVLMTYLNKVIIPLSSTLPSGDYGSIAIAYSSVLNYRGEISSKNLGVIGGSANLDESKGLLTITPVAHEWQGTQEEYDALDNHTDYDNYYIVEASE